MNKTLRGFAAALAALLFGACATGGAVTPGKTAADAGVCLVAIVGEISLGVADPVFKALGQNPNVNDIIKALQEAGSMLPATIAACTALASDVHLIVAPPPSPTPTPASPAMKASRAAPKAPNAVPNPWGKY